MNTKIRMFKLIGKIAVIPVRTVKADNTFKSDGRVRCGWCRHFNARPVGMFITDGVTVSAVECLCYCGVCELGTVVLFELPTEQAGKVEPIPPWPR
jgi:hypothetical protein